jgi:ferredoxin
LERPVRLVLILGILLNLLALPIVVRRLVFLVRLITSGQPAPERLHGAGARVATAIKGQIVEVFGQRKLLKWTVPGVAHLVVFWAFMILSTVYVEAYGALFKPDFEIPIIGDWRILGFAQDTIALLALGGIIAFGAVRFANSPAKLGRKSRFLGSHLGGAWLVLFFIFTVLWTMFLFRGAAAALGNFTNEGAWVSQAIGRWLGGLSHGTLEFLEGLGLLLHIGVMLAFLIEVVHSKHLHIFAGPVNVAFKRPPVALGAAQPLMVNGVPVTMEDLEQMEEEPSLGAGKIEDFTWKGLLDFSTCTECGRCQSQCPAWNTDKPLSPKLMIMNLRDHAYAKGPWILAGEEAAPRRTAGEGPGRGRAPAGGCDRRRPVPTQRRGRHRSRRAVVLCHLRCVRRTVPRRHRARRSHHRDASLPDPGRRSLSPRAGRALQEHGEQGQPLGYGCRAPAWTGQRTCPSRSRWSEPTSRISTATTTSSGSVAPVRMRTGQRRPPAPSPSSSTWRT